jgi:hypothetical protein
MTKIAVSNANISNTVNSSGHLTLQSAIVDNGILFGETSVNTTQISVGTSLITPTEISVPSLTINGITYGNVGGIIGHQTFTANGAWIKPGTSGLIYTWYTQSSATNPSNEAGLDALFNTSTSSPTVTFGGTGLHTTNINWSDTLVIGSGNIQTDTKPAYLPSQTFSWQVEGYILAPETGVYTFAVDGDDACDLFVDGVNVANFYGGHAFGSTYGNSWSGTGGGNQIAGTISLVAGQYYSFKARMQDGSGNNGMQVGWKRPSDSIIRLIPSSVFYVSQFGSLPGNTSVLVMVWGGGGGSSSNNTTAAGGGGGACVIGNYTLSQLSDSINLIVGVGGIGSRTTTTSLVDATNGGNSSFGSLVAYGGGGAIGGGSPIGGGGGGSLGIQSSGIGGNPLGGAASNPGGISTFGGGGGGNAAGANGGGSLFGGGGGFRGTGSATGGSSIYGGGGGGFTTGGISVFGGNGGNNSVGAGAIPGGGAGSNTSSVSNGARGEVRIWLIQ